MTFLELIDEVMNKYGKWPSEIVNCIIFWAQEEGGDKVAETLEQLMNDDDLNQKIADYIEKSTNEQA